MWELKLDFQDGSEQVIVSNAYLSSDSFVPKWCVGAKGEHQTQSLQIRIYSRSIAARLASFSKRIKACLYKDGDPYFTGVIRPNVSISVSGTYEEPVSVELLDYSELMHRYVYSAEQVQALDGGEYIQEQIFVGKLPFLDSRNMSGSILGRLFALVGITDITSDIDVPSQGDMEFDIPAGSYIDTLINDICYQFLVDYRFRADGSAVFFSTEPPTTVPNQTIGTSDLINSFQFRKSDDDTDGTTIEYSAYKEAKHLLVVPEAGYSRQSGNILSVWRDWQETDKTVYWDFSCLPNDGDKSQKTIVAVENITLGYESSEGGGHESESTFSVSSYDLEKCVFSHKVKIWWEWVGAWFKARLYADVRWIQSGYKAYGRTGRNPKTYKSNRIHAYENAKRLGDAMYRYIVGSQHRYTFSSFNYYEPGTFWVLSEASVSGIGQTVRILSCKFDVGTSIYTYEAEGIDCAEITAPPNSLEMADIAAMEFGGAPGLTIKAGQTIFSEKSDLYAVYIASGFYVEYYHLPVSWTIDDVPVPAGQLLGVDAIRIPVRSVSVGNHIVKCFCDVSSLRPGEPAALAASRLSVVGDGKDGDPGPPGVPGPPGTDGQSLYTWVAYADDASGSGISAYPTGKKYVGFAYNKTTASMILTPSLYTWAKIEGPQGSPGAQGDTLYTWLKYADTPTSGMSDSPDGKKYIGLAYNKTTATESTAYGDYTWSLIKGEKGDAGVNAKGFSITASSMIFSADSSGNILSSSPDITFTAFRQNTAATVTWTCPSLSINTTGDTFELTKARFGNHDSATITATCDGLTDYITVVRVKAGAAGSQGIDGKDATIVILTNEAHVFPASTSGAISTTTLNLDFYGYVGAVAVAPTNIAVVSVPAGVTVGTQSALTGGRRLPVTFADIADAGTIDFNVTCNSLTIRKTFSWSKSKTGATGAAGATGPKGDTGATGEQGPAGTDGGRWYTGTAITGTSATATIFSSSGITSAVVGDMYLNISNSNTYRCTVAGAASVAKWVYVANVKGGQGSPGAAGGRWYSGTGVTGTSTTATIFSGSGVPSAVVGDMYLNTATSNTYRCTVAGAPSIAKWVYVANIKGATGPAPIIQYRYSDKSVVPPQGVNYVVSGDGNYVTWNGNRVAFDEESSWGVASVPLPGMPFKWMRVSLDMGATWEYSIIEQPVVDFFLEAYPVPYGMSSRNVVKTAQTVTIACDRQNTSGATSWSVNRELAIVPGGDGATAVVTIPVGFVYTSFTVSCAVAGVGTKTVQVNGVPAGTYAPMFLGKLTAAPTTTDEGPLMAGDSYLTSGNVPQRWDGYGWNTPTASDSNYAFIMSQSLNAVLADGTDVTQSMASLYAWIGELAAKSATIQRLFAKNVTVGNGDGTASSGFRFRAHQYDANGNILAAPIFDIMYGDKTVWKVVPSTGKIFFGQPNAALDAPLTGFMYDPETETIRSAGDKTIIGADGILGTDEVCANNAKITGNSVFAGLFNCVAIKTSPSQSISTTYTQAGTANQTKNLVNSIGASSGDILRCAVVGGNTAVKYIRIETSGYTSSGYHIIDQWKIFFLDEKYSSVTCGFSITDTFNSPYVPGSVLISYRGYGVWVTSGITLNIYTGGNNLVVNIPSGPTASEIANFEPGQVYRDSNGFLKCTPISS